MEPSQIATALKTATVKCNHNDLSIKSRFIITYKGSEILLHGAPSMALVQGWIEVANLDPLMDEIQKMAGEILDEGLLKIFEDDIEASDTDASPPRWASCLFDGPNPITAWLGIDQGTSVLMVRLELPDDLSERASTILDLMRTYSLGR